MSELPRDFDAAAHARTLESFTHPLGCGDWEHDEHGPACPTCRAITAPDEQGRTPRRKRPGLAALAGSPVLEKRDHDRRALMQSLTDPTDRREARKAARQRDRQRRRGVHRLLLVLDGKKIRNRPASPPTEHAA